MMFDKNLLEQFKTNRQERRGAICLILLVVISVVSFRYIENFRFKKEKTNPELAQVLEDYYANKPEEIKNSKRVYNKKPKRVWQKKTPPKINKKVEYSLFEFDPNEIIYQDLIKLSFTSKQANTLLKFRTSGFVFKTAGDLAKVHGLDKVLLEKIIPLVNIPKLISKDPPQNIVDKNTLKTKDVLATKKVKKTFEKIEINAATREDLIGIYGIGDVYASIIIKYRDRLGGYIELAQIQEAYDFPDTTFQILEKSLTLDTTYRHKLNINEVSFKELQAHPYVSYEQTQILFPFIETRRPIEDLSILNEIMVLDPQVIKKLVPYLKVE